MTILFAGGEEESFVSVSSPAFNTNTLYYDSTFSRGALELLDSDKLTATFTSSAAEFWVHFKGVLWGLSDSPTGTPLLVNSGSTGIIRLRNTGTNTLNLQYYNGSTWTTITDSLIADNTKHEYDLYCKMAASGGEFTLYIDEVEASTFTGDTTQSGASTADSFDLQGLNVGAENWFSQIFAKTTSTLGNRLETLAVDGDGVNTDFTGTYADIDDLGLNDDGTLVTGASNGDESSYTIGSSTTPANAALSALIIATRSSRGSTGPQNMQITSVVSGVTYPDASVSGLDLSLRPYQSILTVNPHTGLAWDDAAIVGTEIGLKAIT